MSSAKTNSAKARPFETPRALPHTRRAPRRGLGLFARLVLKLYRGALVVAAPVLPFYLRARARQGKEDRSRLRERFGRASAPRPEGPLVWVHAVSVGETHAVMSIAEHLVEKGIAVVFTTGTMTAAAIVEERLGSRVIHQYAPLDLPRAARRFLDYWSPDLVVFAESEIWPATTIEISDRRIPHVLVNGRMSDRSFRRWKKTGSLPAALFARYADVAARTAEDAHRFEELGAAPVSVTGDLKAEVLPPRVSPALKAKFREVVDGRLVWVAASTHVGEEEMAGRVHLALKARYPSLLTVIVPRHPERGEALAQRLKTMGLTVARRSLKQPILRDTDVFLGDTIGEMGLYLRLGRVVFMGRSLASEATGGQNPLEPALLGRAVLHGPAVENFREAYTALDAGGGSRLVVNEKALTVAVHELLADPELAIEAGRKASDTVGGMRGPLATTLQVLAPYTEPLAVRRRLFDLEARGDAR